MNERDYSLSLRENDGENKESSKNKTQFNDNNLT